MNDKRPRASVDLDADLKEWVEEEQAAFEAQYFIRPSESETVKMLLKKAKVILKGQKPPTTPRSKRPAKASALAAATLAGALSLVSPGQASAEPRQDSNVSTFVRATTGYSVDPKRRRETGKAA